MRNILAVQILNGLEELFHDESSLVLAYELIVNDVLEKFTAVTILKHQEANVVPLPDLV